MVDPSLPTDYATKTQGSLSVTRLFGLNLSPGKLRGLQRISNENGTLTMVATDQNSSVIEMLRKSLETLDTVAMTELILDRLRKTPNNQAFLRSIIKNSENDA